MKTSYYLTLTRGQKTSGLAVAVLGVFLFSGQITLAEGTLQTETVVLQQTVLEEPTIDGELKKDETVATVSAEDKTHSNEEKDTTNAKLSPQKPQQSFSSTADGIAPLISQVGKSSKPQIDTGVGALLYKYDFEVPEGRKGQTPKTSIIYNSQSLKDSSIFGYGWSLNIPYIERQNKRGSNKLYTEFDFVSSQAGELTAFSTSTGQYGAKVDTTENLKFTFASSTNSWIVKDKSGTTYIYGLTSASRQDDVNDTTKVYRWMLERVEDTNGNRIDYTYFKDQGQIYPDTIFYTNTASQTGIYKVAFLRQSRPDVVTDFSPKFKVVTASRINEIRVDVNNIWSRKYTLNYITQATTTRSLLSSITESGQKNSATSTKPSTTFDYQTNNTPSWQTPTTWTAPADQYAIDFYNLINATSSAPITQGQPSKISFSTTVGDSSVKAILNDVNGDGLLDAIQSMRAFVNNTYGRYDKTYIYLNTGNGWAYDPTWATPTDQWSYDYYTAAGATSSMPMTQGQPSKISFNTANAQDESIRAELVDVNGDGLVDAVQSFRQYMNSSYGTFDKSYIYINNGNSWVYDPNWILPTDQYATDFYIAANATSSAPMSQGQPSKVSLSTTPGDSSVKALMNDINGDGLVDLIQSMRGYINSTYGSFDKTYVYLNNGYGWDYNSSWTTPIDQYSFDYYTTAGATSSMPMTQGQPSKISFNTPNALDNSIKNQLVDVNGDGLIDAIQSFRQYINSTYGNFDKTYVYLNNGNGWVYEPNFVTPIDQFAVEGYIILNATSSAPMTQGQPSKISFSTNEGDPAVKTVIKDINGDGLVDAVQSFRQYMNSIYGNFDKTFVYLNTGNGWVYDPTWATPTDQWSYNYYTTAGATSSMPLTQGQPSKISFNTDNGNDNSIKNEFADINGDGLEDSIQSFRQYMNSTYGTFDKTYIYLNSTQKKLLQKITLPTGGFYTATYKSSPHYVSSSTPQNKRPHFSVVTLDTLTQNDGLGNSEQTSYSYSGGSYHFNNPFDKKFAGFEKVTETKSDGSKSINYYHQGDTTNTSQYEHADSYGKIGKVYRTDTLDPSNNSLQRTTTKYEDVQQVSGQRLVFPTQIVTEHDGTAEANTFTYSTTTGDLLDKTEWGTVTASTPLTFSDSGGDKKTTIYSYITSTSTNVTVLNQITLNNQAGVKTSEKQFVYDGGTLTLGNPTTISDWISGTSTYAVSQKGYNSYGLVISETDPRNKITTHSYDTNNLYKATTTRPLSLISTYVYDLEAGKPLSIKDPNGNLNSYTYDAFGRTLTESTTNDTSTSTQILRYSYQYNDSFATTSPAYTKRITADPLGEYYELYDGLGREIRNLTQATSTIYTVVDTTYGLLNRIAKKTLPYFSSSLPTIYTGANLTPAIQVSNTYDYLGRPLSTTNNLGTTSYTYTGNTTTITDPNNKVKSQITDGLGRLVQVTENLAGTAYNTLYDWTVHNKLARITDSLSNLRNFTYDGLDRRVSVEDLHAPADSNFGSYTYSYDLSGNLTSKLNPRAQITVYTYDDLNRILTEKLSTDTNPRIAYSYDTCANGKGMLCSAVVSGNVTSTYSYTPDGKVKTESVTISGLTGVQSTTYSYDTQQNITEILYPDNTRTNYSYTSNSLPFSVSFKATATSTPTVLVPSVSYNELGKPQVVTTGSGVTVTNTYDPLKLYRLSNKSAQKATSTKVQDIDYTYDTVGNIIALVDKTTTGTKKAVSYLYDDLYRLTRATASSTATSTLLYDTSFSYNPLGNMLTRGTTTYAYVDTDKQNPHTPTTVGTSTLSYDDSGNLLFDGTHRNTWSFRDELATSKVGTTATSTYLYDHNSQRVKASSTAIIYTPNKYYSVVSSTSTKNIYLGDFLIAGIDTKAAVHTPSYYFVDHLGSTEKTTNATGTILTTTDYLPFGDQRVQTGTQRERSYIGERYDGNTKYNYLNARYNDPVRGQFISQDPVFWEIGESRDGINILTDPQLQNSYSYAKNNPILLKDADGRCPVCVLPIIVGLSFYGGYTTGTDLYQGYSSGNGAQLGLGIVGVGLSAIPGVSTEKGAANLFRGYSPQVLGKAGEMAAGVAGKTKDVVQINNRIRIPDEINTIQKTVVEVKNVSRQGLTSQIKDSIDIAKNLGYQPVLKYREGANLSRPLLNAIKNGDINAIPISTKSIMSAIKKITNQ